MKINILVIVKQIKEQNKSWILSDQIREIRDGSCKTSWYSEILRFEVYANHW